MLQPGSDTSHFSQLIHWPEWHGKCMCRAGRESEYFASSSTFYHSSTSKSLYLIFTTTTGSITIIPILKVRKLTQAMQLVPNQSETNEWSQHLTPKFILLIVFTPLALLGALEHFHCLFDHLKHKKGKLGARTVTLNWILPTFHSTPCCPLGFLGPLNFVGRTL